VLLIAVQHRHIIL